MSVTNSSNQYIFAGSLPFDPRLLVAKKANLTLESTWKYAIPGETNKVLTAYNGMIVGVGNDSEENNGIYFLYDPTYKSALSVLHYDNIENWHKLANIADINKLSERIDSIEIPDGVSKSELSDAINALRDELLAKNYITVDDLSSYATKTDIEPLASTDYVDDAISKINIPTVPENISEFNNDAGYLTSDDLQEYAKKSDIPSLDDCATKEDIKDFVSAADVDAKIAQIDIPVVPENISEFTNDAEYVSASELESKGFITADAIQDKSDVGHKHTLADITDYTAPDIPSLEGYATETFVSDSLNTLEQKIKDAEYINKDVDNLTNYDTSSKVDEKIVESLSDYAKTSDIPSLEGVAYTAEVDSKISDATTPIKEDVSKLDKITHKIPFSVVPVKGLYHRQIDQEIRLNAQDVEFALQNSGQNAQKDMFYVGIRFYAPEDAVYFREDMKEVVEDPTYFEFNGEFAGVDALGRKYSVIWLPVAQLVDDTWNYFGINSDMTRLLGWYYSVIWCDADKTPISYNSFRITLANNSCFHNVKSSMILEGVEDVKKWVKSQNYLTEHQDISGKLDTSTYTTDKQQIDSKLTELEDSKATTAFVQEEIGKIEIPSALSELTDDVGYLTEHQDISHLELKTDAEEKLSIAKTYTDNAIKALLGGEVDEAYDTFLELQKILEDDGQLAKELVEHVNSHDEAITEHATSIANNTSAIELNTTKITNLEQNKADTSKLEELLSWGKF